MRYSCSESRCCASVKGHDPVGVLPLCRLAKPAANTHAGEAGFHNVGVVGRAALPAGANGAGRTQRTGGADLAAGGHAAVVKGRTRHKTLAPGIGCSAQAAVHGQRCQSTGSAHSVDVFLYRPISGIRAVNAPPLFGACRQIKGHSTIAHAHLRRGRFCRRRCRGFRRRGRSRRGGSGRCCRRCRRGCGGRFRRSDGCRCRLGS